MADTESKELETKSSTGGGQEEDKREALDKQASPESTEEISAAAGQEEAGKKSTMSTGEYLLITLAVLLIVIVIGGGMFIWARYGTIDGEQEATLDRAQRPLYQLNPFFVPLKAQAGVEKFLRVTISLELSGEGSSQVVVKQMEQIRGTLLQTLLSAVPKDFEYPHGKKALMDKMRTSVNHFLGKDLVQGIRFTNAVLL
jgi:flagellar basal body-associated protein FliL